MLQDQKGYMWFATDMGVSKYNGYQFENFGTDNGLPDNSVFGLHEDRKGRIWFRTFSRKLAYYYQDSIYNIPANNYLENILTSSICLSIYIDKGDTIWAGFNSGNFLKISPPYNKENIRLFNLKEQGLYFVEIDEKGIIYGGDNSEKSELIAYSKTASKLFSLRPEFKISKLKTKTFVSRLHDGTLVGAIDNVLFTFNKKGIINQVEESATIISVIQDFDQSVLSTSFNGITHYKDQSLNQSTIVESAQNKGITSLVIDKENEFWYTSEGQGVFYIPYRNARYYTKEHGLPNSRITCITHDENKVYTGHWNGSISHIDNDQIRFDLAIKTNHQTGSTKINHLFPISEKAIFVGKTTNSYLYSTTKPFQKTEFVHLGIKKIIRNTDGILLAVGNRHIYKLDINQNYKKLYDDTINLYVDDVFEIDQKNLLLCSNLGVFQRNEQKSEELKIFNPLYSSRVVSMAADQQSNLWMATRGAGVIIKIGNELVQIKKENGLVSNMCREVFIDSKNNAWIASNSGISKVRIKSYNPLIYQIDVYNKKNGLLSNEVNHIIEFKNKIWLSHNNSISIFNPDSLKNNFTPPPVYITSVLVNGNKNKNEKLSIKDDTNYITINFVGLSFKNPGSLEYKFNLNGNNSSWIHTKNTSAQFQNLESGHYNFIVYAKNDDGIWSSKPAILSFDILPMWWQTWWLKTIIALALIFGIYFVIKIRLTRLQKRENEKTLLQTKITTTELQALRAQMNPHFIFNAINSVQHFITSNDPDSSQKYLSKFAKLIRYVLDNSKPNAIPLEKEIEAITLYLEIESLRFENRFEYSIKIDQQIDPNFIHIPSMLIQPFIENSIWHGIMLKEGKGKIEITFQLLNDHIKCTIEDNGIGRIKSQEIRSKQNLSTHESMGSTITQDRLEIINQINNSRLSLKITDLANELGLATGTRVELFIPSY